LIHTAQKKTSLTSALGWYGTTGRLSPQNRLCQFPVHSHLLLLLLIFQFFLCPFLQASNKGQVSVPVKV